MTFKYWHAMITLYFLNYLIGKKDIHDVYSMLALALPKPD
jgi:hypothetical protein